MSLIMTHWSYPPWTLQMMNTPNLGYGMAVLLIFLWEEMEKSWNKVPWFRDTNFSFFCDLFGTLGKQCWGHLEPTWPNLSQLFSCEKKWKNLEITCLGSETQISHFLVIYPRPLGSAIGIIWSLLDQIYTMVFVRKKKLLEVKCFGFDAHISYILWLVLDPWEAFVGVIWSLLDQI